MSQEPAVSQIVETLIVPDPAAPSAQVGTLVTQLRAVHQALYDASRAAEDAALHWQPAPGTNRIDMLLAHIAVVEVHLGQVGLLGEKSGHPEDVLGIGPSDTGIPMVEDGVPPETLSDKPLAYFDDLLRKALAHTERIALPMADADLDRRIERRQPAGHVRIINPRWVLHHMIEHLCSHSGQVQMLLHLYRKRSKIQ